MDETRFRNEWESDNCRRPIISQSLRALKSTTVRYLRIMSHNHSPTDDQEPFHSVIPPTARPRAPSRLPAGGALPRVQPLQPALKNRSQKTSQETQQRSFYQPLTSFLISFVVHTALLMVLGLSLLEDRREASQVELIMSPQSPNNDAELDDLMTSPTPLGPTTITDSDDTLLEILTFPDAPHVPWPIAGVPPANTMPNVVGPNWQTDPGLLWERLGGPLGGGLEGRPKEARGKLIRVRGGSSQSEQAVALGLTWLAAHQRNDGGWRINHQEGPCNQRCPDPGTEGSTTAATALALLPFLGANESPKEGEYQEVVKRGLYYLMSRMRESKLGGDFQEGTMYAQGLSAICLCEAYAMTGDSELKEYAQKSIDFICNAQHARGGWRYYPGQPGDTTSFGWQFMALKSARMAGLNVPSPVIERAKSYLDSVQSSNGAFYGYMEKGKAPGPTAVALLSRMYTGWNRDDERLRLGIEYLSQQGPSKNDIYFNYYATQALHHYEGPVWERWNSRMRDQLVKTQSHEGHAAGSWFFPDRHGSVGGRLYTTAMCVMILEVYYRYMPLYSSASIDDAF